MVSQKIIIKNEQGLHMRPAGLLSKAMTAYESDITVNFNGSSFNAKSVMMLMTACIKCGSEIELCCEGPDEADALKKAIEVIESGFGE